MTAPEKINQRSKLLIGILTVLVAGGPVSTDLYLPSLPSIGADFAAPTSATQLTLSVFIAGFALGTLVFGPLSDRFGRRPMMLAGMAVFTAGSIGCAGAGSIETLIAWRLVEAFGGGAGPVLARAVVRDLFAREDAARTLSYMGAAMAVAPALAPMIGGAIHLGFGWRGQFWALAAAGGGLLILVWASVAETNRHPDRDAARPARILRNVFALVSNRAFIGFAATSGFSYGGLFGFISGGAFVVIGVLGVAPESFGFLFVFVAGGFVAGSTVGGALAKRWGVVRMIEAGVWTGVAAAGIGLGLALAGIVSPLSVIAPVAAVFFGCALVFPSATAGAIGPFPHMAGTASSVAGFVQMSIGAAVGAVVGATLDGTTRPLFAVILASSLVALALFYAVVRPADARRTPA
ncbi:MAG: multidrug effflux MFS transporter [Rhodospirillaceae bacterium]|nr:multidrug effflux MFS transporter [Rhodospirillaceae bacterium]